jgi:hypothetical protein
MECLAATPTTGSFLRNRLTGQYFPFAYRSVESVLNFVDVATPRLGHELRKRYADVIPVFRSDKYVKLTSSEKDGITGKIQDMIALMRRERVALIAATSRDEYDWALREALNAAQDDAYLRSLPAEFDPEQFDPSLEQVQPASGGIFTRRRCARLAWPTICCGFNSERVLAAKFSFLRMMGM